MAFIGASLSHVDHQLLPVNVPTLVQLNRTLWDFGGLVKNGTIIIPQGMGGIYHCIATATFEKGTIGIRNLYIDVLGDGAMGVAEQRSNDLITILACQVYKRLEPGQTVALYATSSDGRRLLGGRQNLDPLIELDGDYSPRLTVVRVGE